MQYGSLIIGQQHRPKIHKMFDVVAGTSTGSIIAVAVSRLHWSPAEICREFVSLAPTIFGNARFLGSARSMVGSTGQYDHGPFEQYLQDRLDGVTWAGNEGDVKLVIVALRADTGYSVHCFDSKRYAKSKVPVWKAVRASAAAPTYFDKAVIVDDIESKGKLEFIDGGMRSNCPVTEGYSLLKDEFTSCLIVSVGCGFEPATKIERGYQTATDAAVSFSTDAQECWNKFAKNVKINEKYLFRINPGASTTVGKV